MILKRVNWAFSLTNMLGFLPPTYNFFCHCEGVKRPSQSQYFLNENTTQTVFARNDIIINEITTSFTASIPRNDRYFDGRGTCFKIF